MPSAPIRMSPCAVSPFCERQRHAAGVLIDALDARAQRDASPVGQAAQQHVEQFGAMRRVVGRAEMRFGLLAERRVVEALAGVPAAIVAAFRIGRDFPQRFAEAELEQDARGVGGHLNAGADLAERGGLLVELHIDAALAQRQHRGDAADAAADNENLQTGHGLSVLRGTCRAIVLRFAVRARLRGRALFRACGFENPHHLGVTALLRMSERRDALPVRDVQVRAGLHDRFERVGVIACRRCRARSTPSARSSRDC